MIIVAGTIPAKPDKIKDAIAAMQEMAAATQLEAGCIHYQFYQDINDPALFLVFEKWESAETLAAHMETPHMAVLREKMPDLVGGPSDIQRYEVD